jgi:hypothetical protein
MCTLCAGWGHLFLDAPYSDGRLYPSAAVRSPWVSEMVSGCSLYALILQEAQ